MEKASRVMYSIANIFNWVLVILSLVGIVFSALAIADVFDVFNNTPLDGYGVGTLIGFIFMFIIAIIIVALVRKAKQQGSSKFWDVLFIIFGFLGGNIFYLLGGIFGLVARR